MLPRRRRLTRSGEIRTVMRRGRIFETPHIRLHVLRSRFGAPRWSFVVSVKVSKRATVRNTLKRRMRALVAARAAAFPDFDYVLHGRGSGAAPSSAVLGRELDQLLSLLTRTRYHRA